MNNSEKLNSLISSEVITQFVIEAGELLDKTEQNLLALEKDPFSKELTEGTFRSIHSLKGNAGFMEYTDIVSICHKAESFLDKLRTGGVQADSEQISLLLKVVDTLRYAIENLTQNQHPLKAGKIELIKLMEDVFELNDQNIDSSEIANLKNKSCKKEKNLNSKNISSSQNHNQQDVKRGTRTIGERNETKEIIRVDVKMLNRLMNLVGEIVISESMISQHEDLVGIESPALEKSVRNHQKNVRELQELATSMRMVPLSGLFSKMRRLVRDISKKHNKRIDIIIKGDETEVDRSVIEHISDPLVHILRNAIDHGIESIKERTNKGKNQIGQIILSAQRVSGEIWIEVFDDGTGLNHDKIIAKAKEQGLINDSDENLLYVNPWHFIFSPGFSTSEKITDISGRGVGLDVVIRNIEEIHGRVDVESEEDKGTKFTLKIPLTTAIVDGMLMRVCNSLYAIPTQDIKESVHVLQSSMIDLVNGQEVMHIRDNLIPILRLKELHHIKNEEQKRNEGIVVVAENIGKKVGFFVDEIIGQQQLVIKPLSRYTGNIVGVSGCSVIGNGNICLILDLASLVKFSESSFQNRSEIKINQDVIPK